MFVIQISEIALFCNFLRLVSILSKNGAQSAFVERIGYGDCLNHERGRDVGDERRDSQQSQTNPETGAPWGEPEVPATIDFELLNEGQPIDQTRVQALVAFLETLTDRRYEALLK